jgi:hypothetical protein
MWAQWTVYVPQALRGTYYLVISLGVVRLISNSVAISSETIRFATCFSSPKAMTQPRRNVASPASLSGNVTTVLVHHPANRVARVILLRTNKVQQKIFWFPPLHLQQTSPFMSVGGNKKVKVTESIISQSIVCVSIPLCVISFSSIFCGTSTLKNITTKKVSLMYVFIRKLSFYKKYILQRSH